MPWSGSAPSQSFTRTDGVRTGDDVFAQQAAAPVDIEPDLHDVHATDLKDGINACLKKDGGNTASADIPMGGFTLTNISDAGATTEPASFADLRANRGQYVATVGGTADAITLTPTIAIAAYAAGQRFSFIAGSDNTGAATVAISSLAAKDIKRNDGSNTALAAGDIQSGAVVDIEYDGTRFLMLSAVGALLAANNLSDVASTSTARTNLGLGTGDSPQFTAVNIGAASDTTITRTGAGDIAVEGNAIYRAGGTDVPVTDGGTGASTAANARTNLGVAYASQANMEALAATAVVIPSVQHFHPGHCKAWVNFTVSGGVVTVQASYNVSGVVRDSTGLFTISFTTAFADTKYAFSGTARSDATFRHLVAGPDGGTKTEGALQIETVRIGSSPAVGDAPEVSVVAFGDFA